MEISGIERDIEETETVYDYLLDILQQMKNLDLDLLKSIKEKVHYYLLRKQRSMNQWTSD